MDVPFIIDRQALADAGELMERYGIEAAREADARAATSRNDGNVLRFCHWRQIGRVIDALACQDVRGAVH